MPFITAIRPSTVIASTPVRMLHTMSRKKRSPGAPGAGADARAAVRGAAAGRRRVMVFRRSAGVAGMDASGATRRFALAMSYVQADGVAADGLRPLPQAVCRGESAVTVATTCDYVVFRGFGAGERYKVARSLRNCNRPDEVG